MAHTLPSLSAPGASWETIVMPYTFEGSRVSTVVVAVMHRFCIGMYIVFVCGLYAPAGQFLPPLLPGDTTFFSLMRVNSISRVTLTSPVVPSQGLTTVCATVCPA